MLRYERSEEILNLLREKQQMTVSELCKILFTSESSIRRDLARLEEKGLVKRHYGGVELLRTTSIIPFSARSHHNIEAKQKIAAKAAELVNTGDIVFLDQSSSALFLAAELEQKSGITIVTNNTEILSLLSASRLDVFSSGGILSTDNRNCLMGEDAHAIFNKMRADLVFFSAKALSQEGKIYDCNRSEVCIRQTMLDNAEKKVFLCDSEKIGNSAGFLQCDLTDVDFIVSEKSVPGRYTTDFKNLKVI
ncbi:MAG: DeoR/GlpR transcriptional regulator [Clostridia bacterium]|nr:DeoR/GlpR transcriptional regulator [Clostridia bacterium]